MINIPEEIKQLLKDGSVRKNFRVHFPNGERADITNENVISESVTLTESLCSQNSLTFGLCEVPQIEFETFGVEKIKGCEIECLIEVKQNDGTYYSIPLGKFIVDSCKKQADMTHRRIVAYGKSLIDGLSFSDSVVQRSSLLHKSNYKYDIAKRLMTYFDTETIKNMCSMTPTSVTKVQTSYRYNHLFDDSQYSYYLAINTSLYELPINTTDFFVVETGELSVPFEILANECIENGREYFETYGIEFTSSLETKIKSSISAYNVAYINVYDTTYQTGAYALGTNKENLSLYTALNPSSKDSVATRIGIGYTYNFCRKAKSSSSYVDRTATVTFKDNAKFKFYSVSSPLFEKFFITENRTKNSMGYYVWKNSWSSDDVRKYITSLIELLGKLGKNKRDGTIEVISLKDNFSALYPSEILYPSNMLYPNGPNGGEIQKSNYHTLWYDDDNTIPIQAVKCQYFNGTEDMEKTVYADGYNGQGLSDSEFITYDLSNNALIKSGTVSDSNITSILNEFLNNASGISYMPSEITMIGRPDIEVGDVLEVYSDDEVITTIVLQRTLSGIQALTDEIRSSWEGV